MIDETVPHAGSTLIVGPMQSGKTRLTASTLERYIDTYGPSGVVVLDFAPEIQTENGIIGGRLTRFIDLPDAVHYAAIEARGPRSEGETPEAASRIASDNATAAHAAIVEAPAPHAVFVNDVTIAFQHASSDLGELLTYCDPADCVVINAYRGETFDATDPITVTERSVVDQLIDWADRVIELEAP